LPQDLPWEWCEDINLPYDERWLIETKEKIRGRTGYRPSRYSMDIINFIKKNCFQEHGTKKV
jgi:hypothetical protein